MEIDDFVETSDVEELHELEEDKRNLRQRDDSFNSYSPRKRIKVCLAMPFLPRFQLTSLPSFIMELLMMQHGHILRVPS